jgi:hypothetical protein
LAGSAVAAELREFEKEDDADGEPEKDWDWEEALAGGPPLMEEEFEGRREWAPRLMGGRGGLSAPARMSVRSEGRDGVGVGVKESSSSSDSSAGSGGDSARQEEEPRVRNVTVG